MNNRAIIIPLYLCQKLLQLRRLKLRWMFFCYFSVPWAYIDPSIVAIDKQQGRLLVFSQLKSHVISHLLLMLPKNYRITKELKNTLELLWAILGISCWVNFLLQNLVSLYSLFVLSSLHWFCHRVLSVTVISIKFLILKLWLPPTRFQLSYHVLNPQQVPETPYTLCIPE